MGGSLVLGLAFLRGEIDQKKLFETAFLDELWQVERWGSDFEAEDRRGFIQTELDDVATFLRLLGAAQ
jgi:chaperone required for assembly of F1-ATPase